MGDINRTVEVIFEGTDRLSSVVNNVGSRIDSLSGSIGDMTQPFADLADNILLAEAALAALAVGGLAYAYSQSVQFESAVIELQKVIGDQPEALDAARDAAIDLSSTYGESATGILASVANFKQAGFEVYDSMELTRTALDLVIAGGLEMDQASEIIVSALKGFGAEASEATRLIDILNEVSNRFATDVEQLGEGFAVLSPIARQAGFSFEETAGLLTPVIEVFRSGTEAATALKTGLTRLVDDANPVREALTSIGVAQTDANGVLRSARDIFYDVAEAFVDMDENQKLFVASTLFGREQAARLITVFNDLNKVQAVTAAAFEANGSAAQEVAARLASAEVQLNIFIESWKNLAVSIGDQYKIATTEAVAGASALIQSIRDLVEGGAFDPIFDLINEIASDFGRTFTDIANNLPDAFENVDFSDLIRSVRSVGIELGQLIDAFFGDIDLSTPEGLADAIQIVVDSMTALNRVVEGILDSFEPFAAALGDLLYEFLSSDEAIQVFTGQFLGISKAINSVVNNLDFLVAGINIIGGALSLLSITQLASAVGGFGALGTAIASAGAALGPLAAGLSALGLGAAIGYTLDRYVPAFSAAADATFDWVASLLGAEAATKSNLEAAQAFEAETAEVVREVQAMSGALDEIPSEKGVDVQVSGGDDAQLTFEGLLADIQAIPFSKTVIAEADVDTESFDQAGEFIIRQLPDSDTVEIIASPNRESFDEAEAAVDELPTEKLMEIRLRGDIETEIEQIRARAETVQTAVEWRAKLDIAEVEANAEIVTSAFESISTTIDSTGGTIAELFGLLTDAWGSTRFEIEQQIRDEQERRDKALELQEDLTRAQIEYIQARTEAVDRGDGVITISGDGLEPEIEAFMWKILERIKVRATEDQAEFLLGIGP